MLLATHTHVPHVRTPVHRWRDAVDPAGCLGRWTRAADRAQPIRADDGDRTTAGRPNGRQPDDDVRHAATRRRMRWPGERPVASTVNA